MNILTAGSSAELAFLAGGGEMGERIRAFDWASTPLGPPAHWPQSLKTAIRIMLTSRQPIWIGWGAQLTYFYNDAYKSIIRGRHPMALGKPSTEVWPEVWPVIGPMLETAMEGIEGTYVEEQLLIMERDGYREETYYTYSYTPIPDERGEAGGIICANTDDTERVISQRQLSLLRELAALTSDLRTWDEVCQRASLALASDRKDLPFSLLYMLDELGADAVLVGGTGLPSGHAAAPRSIPLDNSSLWPMAETLQSNAPQIVSRLGERHLDLPSDPWSQPPTTAVVLPIAASNEPGRSGRSGVLIVGLNPFRQYNEDYRSFLALLARQITGAITIATNYEQERKRAEALAELDRAKTEFFNNISHEFRTPLTLMLGPIEELLHDKPTAEQRARIELLHRNSLRLFKMVNTLLEFSRIQANRVEASYEPTDLAIYTAELASVFRSAVEKAGLLFKVDCPPLPEPVYVDREMWEKIVLNLISNAVKFTFDGEIAVSLHHRGERVELEVRDTGVGIPASEQPKLFQRFFRVRGSASRTHEGTGIGLALVQELAHLHGGEVRAESDDGHGSAFIVSIPTGRRHLPSERIRAPDNASRHAGVSAFVEEALRWVPNGNASTIDSSETASELAQASSDFNDPGMDQGRQKVYELPEGTPPRVLIADDNSDMRDYLRRLLASHFKVETVTDGQAALERIATRLPDLVITDVMMPRVDGFALLQKLRADSRTRLLPVIMLSARAAGEARVEGLESGADDYLIKPFSARELLARVESQLRLSRMRRESEERVRQANEQLTQRVAELQDARQAALKDLTERQRAEEELAKAHQQLASRAVQLEALVQERTAELQEIIGELEAFSYSIAHDMRAPLRALQGFGQFLATEYMDKIDATGQHYLRRLIASAARMDRLILDILNYSRIVRGALPMQAVELEKLLRELVGSYPSLQHPDVTILLEGPFPKVLGNDAALTQVFSNLLDNAVKFVAPGVKPVVRVRTETHDGCVRCFVQDNGVGIDPSQHDRIFAIFQRVSNAYEGTGIGLAVVKKAAERMGGRVGVDSELGHGSSFWLELERGAETVTR